MSTPFAWEGGGIGFIVASVTGAVVGGLVRGLVGFYILDLIVYYLGDKRQQKIRRNLPDMLDILTISVEAGLGFDAALAQVTRYGPGPVADEFARMLHEMHLGLSRVEALCALAGRTPVNELRSFTSVIASRSPRRSPNSPTRSDRRREGLQHAPPIPQRNGAVVNQEKHADR